MINVTRNNTWLINGYLSNVMNSTYESLFSLKDSCAPVMLGILFMDTVSVHIKGTYALLTINFGLTITYTNVYKTCPRSTVTLRCLSDLCFLSLWGCIFPYCVTVKEYPSCFFNVRCYISSLTKWGNALVYALLLQ